MGFITTRPVRGGWLCVLIFIWFAAAGGRATVAAPNGISGFPPPLPPEALRPMVFPNPASQPAQSWPLDHVSASPSRIPDGPLHPAAGMPLPLGGLVPGHRYEVELNGRFDAPLLLELPASSQ